MANRVAIDTTADLSKWLPTLQRAGVKAACRYVSRAPDNSASAYKHLKLPEAKALSAAGIQIVFNFEGAGDKIAAFSEAMGYADGKHARERAFGLFNMPSEAAIYFSCEPTVYGATDFNTRVLPYYRAVKKALTEDRADGIRKYRVGAYTFGTWLDALLKEDLIEYCWLPGATGWPGFTAFLNSGRWHLRQYPTSKIEGLEIDWNDWNPAKTDIGAWRYATVDPIPDTNQPAPEPLIVPMTVWRGSRGDGVRQLQTLLHVYVDGLFGAVTENAVRSYQRNNGLMVDGIVGPITWRSLLTGGK